MESVNDRIGFYTKLLKEMLMDDSIEVTKIASVCKNGENFVGDLKRICYRFKNTSNEVTNKTMIFKLLLPSESPECQIMKCSVMFKNEVISYSEILPELQKTLPHIALKVPRCFLANDDCLAFQDMAAQHFVLKDKKIGLNLEELKQTLMVVADLHARSFILKSKSPEKFKELSSRLHEAVFSESYHGKIVEVFWENSLWTARESLCKSNEDILRRASSFFEKFQGAVLLTLRKLTECSDLLRVICHGDLWCNNILFRWDSSGDLKSVCLLDFQAMRPSSCALDILHLLCSSSEQKTIGNHFSELLQSYYDVLTQTLSNEGLTPAFTLECLLEEVKRKVMFGVILGFMMIQCSTSDSQPEGFALDKNVLTSEMFRKSNYDQLSEFYHLRVRQLVKDLIQSDLLAF